MSRDLTAVTVTPPTSFSAWWGGVTSIFFWVVLLTAAALYAGVSLAPKIVQWQRWQQVYVAQRYQLVEQENQVDALQRMVTALDQDPQFVAELVRLELDATATGEEVIPVDDSLTHDPRNGVASAVASLPPSMPDPWEPWLIVLSTHDSLRTSLLTAAAVLVIAAFTFLHDGSETQKAIRANAPESSLSVWEFCRQRYFTPVVEPARPDLAVSVSLDSLDDAAA